MRNCDTGDFLSGVTRDASERADRHVNTPAHTGELTAQHARNAKDTLRIHDGRPSPPRSWLGMKPSHPTRVKGRRERDRHTGLGHSVHYARRQFDALRTELPTHEDVLADYPR